MISLESAQLAADMGCRGKLGGWIIQGATHKNANYYNPQGHPLLIKPEIAQPDPRTERQQAQRLIVAHATRDWQNGTPEERARGAETAKRKNLPLFQGYLSLRIKELIAMPTIDDIPGLRDTLDGLQTAINTLSDDMPGQADQAFTPSITIGGSAAGITYTTQQGRYTKCGKVAVASFRIDISSKGGLVGTIGIVGLPNMATMPSGPPVLGAGSLISGVGNQLIGLTIQQPVNSNAIVALKQENPTITLLSDTDIVAGSQIRGSITYNTAT